MKKRAIFLLSVFFTAILTFGLSESYRYYNSHNTVPLLDEQILIKKLKSKLNLRNDVVISIGPYHAFRSYILGDNDITFSIDIDLSNSAYLFCSAGVCYLMFDYEFYKRLSSEMRRLVIAHEFWHAYRWEEKGNRVRSLSRDKAIEEEKRADTFASAYVRSEVILQFLNAYCEDEEEREARIDNIKKLMIS